MLNNGATMGQKLMQTYRARRDNARKTLHDKYRIHGFISSGTYGRVYKASINAGSEGADKAGDRMGLAGEVYAIKKFKPEKEGEVIQYTGLSLSACREIALNRECNHVNVIALREVMFEGRAVLLVFEYAEHDFLQIIHHHASHSRQSIPMPIMKSLLFQLINGVAYLHSNFIMHRDLKPANILVTDKGVVKIGDLGLARLFHRPLLPLSSGDKVVVTIWYRAPELLLGARHYTTAIDMWAIGCIFAELISLRPIFKGEEAKMDLKKSLPFQRDQMLKIIEVLGTPSMEDWPRQYDMPDFHHMNSIDRFESTLPKWCESRMKGTEEGCDLFAGLFKWDPDQRMTAATALKHPFFLVEKPIPTQNAFASTHKPYPPRRVTVDDVPNIIGISATQAQQPTLPPSKPTAGTAHLFQRQNMPARKRPRLEQ